MRHRSPKVESYRRRLDTKSLRVMAPMWTPPMTNPVAVVAVTVVSAQVLRWTFSSPITAVGANPAWFEASTSDEFFSCDGAILNGTNSLLVSYSVDLNFLNPGEPPRYLVNTAPVGLTFATGTLALPQYGNPVNPFSLRANPNANAKRRRSPRTPSQSPASNQ